MGLLSGKNDDDKARKAAEHINFVAQAQGRQHHDNADAARAEELRALGREIGQEKEYNRRADRYLKSRGY